MATDLETTETIYRQDLTYEIKKNARSHIKEIESTINSLAELPKTLNKTKQELREVLCRSCRLKSHEILKLKLVTFADNGCQTEHLSKDPELSNNIKELLNCRIVNLIEDEIMGIIKSRSDNFETQSHGSDMTDRDVTQFGKMSVPDKQTSCANQYLQTLPETGTDQEEQDKEIEKIAELTEQITRLQSEKEDLQKDLKIHQETVQKLQTEFGEFRTEHEKTLASLTSENEKLQNTIQTQNSTIEKLRTTIDMKVQEMDATSNDIYYPMPRKVQNHSFSDNVEASPNRDIVQKQLLEMDKRYMDQEKKLDGDQIKKKEMEFEKLTKDVENQDSYQSSVQSQEISPPREHKSFTLHSSTTKETIQTLQSEKEQSDFERKQLEDENKEIREKLKEQGKRLTEAVTEQDELRTEITRLQEENRVRDDEIGNLKSEKFKADTDLKRLKRENQNLQNDMNDFECIESKMNTIKAENAMLRGNKGARDDELKKLEAEKQKLTSHVKGLKQENQILQAKVGNFDERLTRTESELKRSKTEMNELRDSQKVWDNELESSESEKKKAESQLEQLKQDNEKLERHLLDLNTQMTNMESEMKKIQAENKDITNKADSQIKQLEREKQNLQGELDKLNAKILQSEREMRKTQAEKEALKESQRDELESCKREKDSHIQKIIREKQKLHKDLVERNTEMAQSKSELKKIQTENQKLNISRKTQDDELKKWKNEKSKLGLHLERVKQENQILQTKADDLDARITQTESELKRTKTEKKELLDNQRTQDTEVKKLKNEKSKLGSDMECLKQENQLLRTKVDDRDARIIQTESKLERTQAEKEELLNNQKTQDAKVKKLENENSKLGLHLERVKQENQILQTKADDLDARITQTESELKRTKTEKNELLDNQNDKMKTMSDQIAELSRPKNIVIGLRSEKSGLGKALVDMVTKELTRRLQDRVNMFNLKLNISFSQTPSEVTNGLQVVLCLNMSRVGTNITDTLKGMKADRDVFVMVLHHTNKENLTALTPTSMRVTGSEIRQLGGIMDMAFDSSNGLYECDLNNTAVDKIASILRKCIIV